MDSDLISREEFIETYCEENCGERKCTDSSDKCIFILSLLKHPTVDAVEVVHGEWIYGKWDENHHWVSGAEKVRCSECWRVFDRDNLNIWHWCPQCGAKMDGGRKDEM